MSRSVRFALFAALVLAVRPEAATVAGADPREAGVEAGAFGALLVTEPLALEALERRGFSLGAVLGASGERGKDLIESGVYRDLVDTVARDVGELDARPGVVDSPASPNHPFRASWLSSKRSRFELVAVVERADMRFADPGTCGEVRLIYRLALENEGRPATRLPMTVNLVFPEPPPAGGDCGLSAQRWIDLPRAGRRRVDALAGILASLPRFDRVETDVQNLHGPSLRRDEDDHAEYVLRAFDVTPRGLAPRKLLNTPRTDLDGAERAALAAWIDRSFAAIDAGTAIVPDEFLATRVVSVTPHGLARPRNRVYRALFPDASLFAGLPYAEAKKVRSPAALLRRLDEATCNGCHQSRSVAGFHVLGEERDPGRIGNALEVGISSHLAEELPWRLRGLEATAADADYDEPRPFAEHASPGGGYGAHCGLGDPGFASWTCDPGLRCRDTSGDEVGMCAPDRTNGPGDACQNVTLARAEDPMSADGDPVAPGRVERCRPADPQNRISGCSPNGFGFPGGACTEDCSTEGDVAGSSICAKVPASGFESDCFSRPEPPEACLAEHLLARRVRACSAGSPCRDDFACARVAHAPPGVGACVPPYFVFQARVDGPLLDR
jgi:hypothetical protein